MASDIVATAVAVAAKSSAIKRLRPFEQAVTHFAHLLGNVPDCAPGELTADQINTLSRLVAEVIERIERRLEEHADAESEPQKLVNVVYLIQRHREEIEMWRRHYLGP